MKEIGGYFGLEHFSGTEYYPELVAVNNGRNALLYLLKARHIRKLYIPYFLCSSVAEMCKREGYTYVFYAIGRDFLPIFEGTLAEGEYLYIVNYYGQISNCKAMELKTRYGNIIMDNVQAFFQKPVEGIDTVYSCRKFFGVPDGGYVATDAHLEEELCTDVSKDRMKHVLGRLEGTASEYYQDFKANDMSFHSLPLQRMSALTHNLLRGIDYEAVRQQRNENFALLHSVLGSRNALELAVPEGPYCYPLYCEDGMTIKKRLAERKIYVATLWPNVLELGNCVEKDYARNILPLPCDQRYDAEDMRRMIAEVLACIS